MTDKLTAVVKSYDMKDEMNEKVIETAKKAIDLCNTEQAIATHIKDEIRA